MRERIAAASKAVLCPDSFVFHELGNHSFCLVKITAFEIKDDYPNSCSWLKSTKLLISVEEQFQKSVAENQYLKKYVANTANLHCLLREEQSNSVFEEVISEKIGWFRKFIFCCIFV